MTERIASAAVAEVSEAVDVSAGAGESDGVASSELVEEIAAEGTGGAVAEAGTGASKPSRFDRSIVEGPLGRAVWKLAWPTVLTNMIGGLQGVVDHIVVGN